MGRPNAAGLLLPLIPLLLGFDTSKSTVPPEDIVSGGPPKDGIPAILEPRFVPADRATGLGGDDRVVGVVHDGVAKAYPLRILNWHEVVDDTIGSADVAVSYCPLTATALVFDREVDGKSLTFGVSGQLYQSNVLMYDHQTESLWSQLGGEAVAGPQAGRPLRTIPSVTTTWKTWRAAHPQTLVLSQETGHRRDYGRDPYAEYHAAPHMMFETKHVDARLPVKERVLGVRLGGESAAYRVAALAKSREIEDRVGGTDLRIEYDPESDTAKVHRRSDGQAVDAVVGYWFAWSAFHPDTRLWNGGPKPIVPSPVERNRH